MILLDHNPELSTEQEWRISGDRVRHSDRMGMSICRRTHITRPQGRRWCCLLSCNSAPIAWMRFLISALIILSILGMPVDAFSPKEQSRPRARRHRKVDQASEGILVDRGPPPSLPYNILYRRQGGDLFSSPSKTADQKSSTAIRVSFASTATALSTTATLFPPATSSDISTTATTSLDASATSTSTISAPLPSFSAPRPFDGGLGTNYTQTSCPAFLRSVLNNETFSSCLPLSLLLQVMLNIVCTFVKAPQD